MIGDGLWDFSRRSFGRGTGSIERVRRTAWRASIALGAAAGALLPAAAALGQPVQMLANPVYLNEPPAAVEAQVRVRELLAVGNADEAARVLQTLLDDHADAVVASDDPDVFVSVRERVRGLLLSDPALLERYRAQFSARAEALSDQHELVERTLLLTPSGLDAALRVAQDRLENAQFHAARFVLLELESHPDARGERAASLAGLWTLLSRYLDRDDVRAAAARWRGRAALADAPASPLRWPEAAGAPVQSVFAPAPGLSPKGLVNKPLWSVEHAQPQQSGRVGGLNRSRRARFALPGGVAPSARELNVLPAALGDLVLVNSGTRVIAWDRFTLTPRWTTMPGGPAPAPSELDELSREGRGGFANYGRSEDPFTVTARMGLVLASTSDTDTRDQEGPRRISAMDARTGALRWSVTLGQIDPNLEQGVVRGPVELIEQTAVFAVRKADDRRLVTLTMVGLDAWTGAIRWVRPIASTGSMPWVMQSSGAEAMTSVNGLAFRCDRLGALAAVEAASGRVRWIRRAQVDPASVGEPPDAFQIGSACVLDGKIISLMPDARNVVALEEDTGRVLAARSTADMGSPSPRYLLLAERTLVIVSDERVRVLSADDLERGPVRASSRVDDPGIRGRVSIAGRSVVVPTATAVKIVPIDEPEQSVDLSLDNLGNPLSLESQLVIVDDARVHSYLGWETAEAILRARMRERPWDAQPAITLAELAHRASRLEQLVPAVDAAIATFKVPAPEKEPRDETLLPQRLFDAVHAMALTAIEPLETPLAPDASARALSSRPDVLAGLVDRMGAIAQTPVDRLAHALASGRLSESGSRAAEAVAQYQRVLDEPELSAATWAGLAMSIRGEIEAGRRIEALLRSGGAGLYAAFDQQATGSLAALGPTPTIQQLEALVARYPFANQTPGVWGRIGSTHAAEGRAQQAISSLEAGLRAARRVPSPDLAVVGQLAGELVSALRERGQVGSAIGALNAVRARYPTVVLSTAQGPMDAARLDAELTASLAASQRWPRVGPLSAGNVQVIPDKGVLEPMLESPSPSSPGAVVLVDEQSVSLWCPSRPAGTAIIPGAGNALLRQAASVPLEQREARLLRITGQSAILMLLGAEQGSLVKLSATANEPAWTTEFLARCFVPNELRGLRNAPGVRSERFVMPSYETAGITDLLVTMDARTVVIAQRSGRLAAIDVESGELLWQGESGIARVFDCDVNGAHLVVAGLAQERAGGGEPRSSIRVLDARTGRETLRPVQPPSAPHWVRLTESGGLVVASEDAVMMHDLVSGQINWTLRDEEIMPARAGWVVGDRLVLLSHNRTMLLASISAGQLRPEPLKVPPAILEQARSVNVRPLSPGSSSPIMVSSHTGVAFLSADGDLTGADGLSASTTLLPALPAEDAAITFDAVSDGPGPDGLSGFAALRFQAPTGLLSQRQTVLLGNRPNAMAVMDGLVILDAGPVTLVFDAPVKK